MPDTGEGEAGYSVQTRLPLPKGGPPDPAESPLSMWDLSHIDSFEALCQQVLAFLRDDLSAERCLFLYQEKEAEELAVEAAHGIEPETVFTTAEISQELLRSVRREGKPIILLDAGADPRFGNRTSVVLSNLRSILCLPLRHPSRLVVGLLYADNRIKAGAFTDKHLKLAEEFGQALEQRLFEMRKAGIRIGREPAEPAAPAAPQPLERAAPGPPPPAVKDEVPTLAQHAGFVPPPPTTEDEDVLRKPD
ncbi:GAF domain-containing protein [bacterium CPR1]|nr:GAF domain-containing protein [bacterium CPR1]